MPAEIEKETLREQVNKLEVDIKTGKPTSCPLCGEVLSTQVSTDNSKIYSIDCTVCKFKVRY